MWTTFVVVFVHRTICPSTGCAHFRASLLHRIDRAKDRFIDMSGRGDCERRRRRENGPKGFHGFWRSSLRPFRFREFDLELDVKVTMIVVTIRWHSLAFNDF